MLIVLPLKSLIAVALRILTLFTWDGWQRVANAYAEAWGSFRTRRILRHHRVLFSLGCIRKKRGVRG
jgi:hypothetical protein